MFDFQGSGRHVGFLKFAIFGDFRTKRIILHLLVNLHEHRLKIAASESKFPFSFKIAAATIYFSGKSVSFLHVSSCFLHWLANCMMICQFFGSNSICQIFKIAAAAILNLIRLVDWWVLRRFIGSKVISIFNKFAETGKFQFEGRNPIFWVRPT